MNDSTVNAEWVPLKRIAPGNVVQRAEVMAHLALREKKSDTQECHYDGLLCVENFHPTQLYHIVIYKSDQESVQEDFNLPVDELWDVVLTRVRGKREQTKALHMLLRFPAKTKIGYMIMQITTDYDGESGAAMFLYECLKNAQQQVVEAMKARGLLRSKFSGAAAPKVQATGFFDDDDDVDDDDDFVGNMEIS